LIWLYFTICVVLVLFFGAQLSKYGDVIGEKTGLSGLWVGLLLLAIITSLPEIITGISAVTIVGGREGADLALGTIFGSNALNLFILAILDVASRQGPLFAVVLSRSGHILSALLGIFLIAFAGIIIFLSAEIWDGAIGRLGVYGLVLVAMYVVGSRVIFKSVRLPSLEKDLIHEKYKRVTKRKAYMGFAVSAVAIVGAGTWLALLGDQIVTLTGWGASFVGSLLLAITTSLPELVVAIYALRIGAPDMAIADVLGSNMFNIGVGVFCYDIFSSEGPIFSLVSKSHIFTACIVVLMTFVVVLGLVARPRRRLWRASWYALALAAAYFGAGYAIFAQPWR
jgi:cation:H+ antiporter